MHAALRIGFLSLVMIGLAGCQQVDNQRAARIGPSASEMHGALVTLLKNRPDLAFPEFQESLNKNAPVKRDGIIYFGSWNCDPQLLTFDAVFTSASISMYEVAGSFDQDARGVWLAIPRRVVKTQRQDLGEFWRASEVEPRRI